LAIAARVFAKRGFPNATVREIGAEAGILSGSLYQHFESKDSMLTEILGELLDSLIEAYAAVVAGTDDPVEQFSGLVHCGYAMVAEHRVAMTILHNDFAYISGLPQFDFVNDFNDQLAKIWVEVLRRGVDEGRFRPGLDIFLTYREVMGAMLAAVRWYDPNGRISPAQVADHHVAVYFLGMLDEAQHRPVARGPSVRGN
jgi:AcrR family transcriptional regulator